ncbi:MAG: apolipoprotein N-acyltransferase [Candidatus Krumholzibacteriia bacterium]
MKWLAARKWFPPLRLVLPAAASGALLSLAYPPRNLGVLSFIALVPLVVACYRRAYTRRAFFNAGYLFGIAFFLGHLWWIVFLSSSSSITVPWLMVPALALLVLYLAVYPALFFLLLRTLGRGSLAAAVVLAPALWLLTEIARSSGELGFSWGAVGYSLTRHPALVQSATLGGVFGVGAVIVLVNMLWSYAVAGRGPRRRVVAMVAGAVVIAGMAVYGHERIRRFDDDAPARTHRVSVVQPNVDLAVKWNPEHRDTTLRLIERLTRQCALLEPEMIVFPETCAPVFIGNDTAFRDGLSNLAQELEVGIFIGFLDARYEAIGRVAAVYNSSGLFYPNGGLARYNKNHLLPFGEAIPLAWKFPGLKKINFGQANFDPGTTDAAIESPIGELAPLICFEAIFPAASRRAVSRGADVLVNITNDGWFGDTPGPFQHADMAVYRAVENGRYLLRSANTGVSMVVDPLGRIVASLGLNEEGFLVENIREIEGRTLFTRLGNAWLVAIAGLLVTCGTLVARISDRSSQSSSACK